MKKLLIIVFTLLIIGIVGGLVYLSFYNKKVKITLQKDLTVPVHTEVHNLDFVKDVQDGKIITKKEKIDTSKVGTVKVQLVLQNDFGSKQNYFYKIKVVDITAPEITYQDSYTITEGEEIDLLKDIKAMDDVDGEIEVTIEGEYDFDVPDTYHLSYVATDSSGNETKKDFTLIVKEKVHVIEKPITTTTMPDNKEKSSKGFQIVTKNGITTIDGILIVNKTYNLPSSYGNGLTSETNQAFQQMKAGAASSGLNITIISGYRSFEKQNTIYHNYVAKDGQEAADRYSARPGYSEHQTGLAIDINSLYTSFENTPEGKWLKNNCYKYGFILRYPKDGEGITGYMYEPWHFRYVGIELATKLYNGGNWITLEEYFGIPSKYS